MKSGAGGGTSRDLREDDLLATVEAIHTAGHDESAWPRALEAITNAFNGVGTTLELLDKKRGGHLDYHFFGLPPAHQVEYAEHYVPISPRIAFGLSSPNGHIHWDYQVIDEAGIRRDPFYAEFLPRLGLRYSVAGTLWQNARNSPSSPFSARPNRDMSATAKSR